MNTFNIALDLNKSKVTTPIRLRQGDLDGTTITALILDHGATADLTGLAARFVMELPGGEHYYRKDATVGEGSVTVTINEGQAASVTGRTTRAYFQLLDGETVRASTGSVTVDILPDALEGHTVPADYDSAIQDAIDALDDAVENIADTVEDVLEDHPEWTTTVQDGAVTDAKLYQGTDGILARNERLMYRLDNLLTSTPVESDSLTVTDAARTPMAGLALYGRSTQDGTPTPSSPVAIKSVAPLNLLDLSSMVGSKNRCTVEVDDDGGLTLTSTEVGEIWVGFTMTASGTWVDSVYGKAIPVTAGEELYLMEFGTARRIFITWLDADKRYISFQDVLMENNPLKAFTVPSGAHYAGLRVGVPGERVTAVGQRFTSRLVVTRTPCTYFAPYQSVALHASGRNMLDLTLNVGNRRNCSYVAESDGSLTLTSTADGEIWCGSLIGTTGGPYSPECGQLIPVVGDTTIYIGTYGTANRTFVCFFDADLRQISFQDAQTSATVRQMTVPTNARYICFRIGVANSVAGQSYTVKTVVSMVAPTGYVPFAESVTPIDLQGHELRSLPDGTRDEVTVDERGHAVLVQRVGELTPQGESAIWSARESDGRIVVRVPDIKPTTGNNEVSPSLSDRFVFKSLNAATAAGDAAVWPNEVGDRVRVSLHTGASGISSTPAAAAWLAANPVTLLYPLATPVTHDLGTVEPVPLVGPDLTAQAVPTAPFALTYERDLNTTLARLEAAIAALA